MSGPNSAPNGDTSIVKGHANEALVCETHYDHHLDKCENNMLLWTPESPRCKVVSLRDYLAKRNRLRTGKTK